MSSPSFCAFLERVDAFAARGADAHARFLGHLLDAFHEVLAPLFAERGDRQADDLAIDGGIDADLAIP